MLDQLCFAFQHKVCIHELGTGRRLYCLPLGIGSVLDIAAKKANLEVFLSFQSFTVPKIIYRIDFATAERTDTPALEEWRRTHITGFDEQAFMTQQLFFESKDRTRVPMYIISLRNTSRSGNSPTILNGYGGFNIAETPHFSLYYLMFMKHFRGVIALANIRGGGEYGERWHRGGMRENKQNVFDDFIGAAEFLINNNYTNNRKLAIHGGSNGGLLVATCSQQRPDLYGAVIGSVGYSPLHNIRFPENGQWPSTLMITADHDDRVVPSHTLKYAATLYEKAKMHPQQTNPLIFRVEENAGHGNGKPTGRRISEYVDMFSFLQRVLNITWQDR
ncbi:peptidase, S9A/B/C family, catalytic domain protein [Ancylostoma caninum]|uniref:Prolyl endopeptidase n=1 Tax=Ancylostoma caninum TaxID=29170 RepID=A0A368FS63_ANCCA|nr:peptidase, S9A/B/C family, catalytic domain protein [Ancylostoma caninum]